MCQMSHTTLVASKNVQILTVLEFDEIQRSRDDSNGEIRFIIRDLEKFWIFTEMTILPFFRKLDFLGVSQGNSTIIDDHFYRYSVDKLSII